MNITDVGANNLRLAIIEQAKKDYKKAVRNGCRSTERDLERFFCGGWCSTLIGGIDGESIIEALKMQVRYEKWRDLRGCNGCGYKSCIHKSGEHYTAVERDELSCKKEDV